jgi:hypothetical protein
MLFTSFLVFTNVCSYLWTKKDTHFQVAEKTSHLRPIELKLVPMALEGSAFRGKVLDVDELMSYRSFFAVRFEYFIFAV